ncbi:hypothetical protein C0J52_21588, partial [Blattella germanica]
RKLNTQNVRIWGTEPPRAVLQHVRDFPKINVFCAVSHMKVYGPFFFEERTVNGARYLDMLQSWLIPQLNEQQDDFVFQPENNALAFWPPRSPDLTPCEFFLWGFVKDRVFLPPLPLNLDDFKQRIRQAVASVDADMLQSVWNELDYRMDVCRVTGGAILNICEFTVLTSRSPLQTSENGVKLS